MVQQKRARVLLAAYSHRVSPDSLRPNLFLCKKNETILFKPVFAMKWDTSPSPSWVLLLNLPAHSLPQELCNWFFSPPVASVFTWSSSQHPDLRILRGWRVDLGGIVCNSGTTRPMACDLQRKPETPMSHEPEPLAHTSLVMRRNLGCQQCRMGCYGDK